MKKRGRPSLSGEGETPRLSLRLLPELEAELDARDANQSLALRRSLARYFALLDEERRRLAGRFTGAELSLLADVLNGTLLEPWIVGALAMEVADAETFYAEKWKIDRRALIGKLRALAPGEELALADAVERYWYTVGEGEQPKPDDLLREEQR